MLRVLVFSQYFWPESFRINEVVATLAARGVPTDVLTGKPNYPDGKVFAGYRAMGTSVEDHDGAHIFRVPLFPRGKNSRIRLALNYLSFIVSAGIFAPWLLRKTRPDVILVYAPSPLLQALPALLVGRLKRIPVAVYVQDLWPESIEATGYVRNNSVIGMVEHLVRFIYRHADLILISSLPFKEAVQRYSPRAKIVYYPNSVDAAFCNPDSGSKPDVPPLEEGFSVVFAGNVGAAQAVHTIVEAAAALRSYPKIRLVVLGSGSELEWMQTQKQALQLHNLHLAGRFPVNAMPYLLSKASALLVTLADRPIFSATVPSKIQAYMAVGRPIIACLNGEGARLVSEAKAGLLAPAEDSAALAEAILRLYRMPPEERAQMGSHGQAYYRRYFDHETLVTDLLDHLKAITRSKQP